jgi:hypothetical protein
MSTRGVEGRPGIAGAPRTLGGVRGHVLGPYETTPVLGTVATA